MNKKIIFIIFLLVGIAGLQAFEETYESVTVRLSDNEEPGVMDFFQIELEIPYWGQISDGIKLISPVINLNPKPYMLNEPGQLVFNYSEKEIPENVPEIEDNIFIAYRMGKNWIRLAESNLDFGKSEISAEIYHFGEFAVFSKTRPNGIYAMDLLNLNRKNLLLLGGPYAGTSEWDDFYEILKEKGLDYNIFVFEGGTESPAENIELLKSELMSLAQRYGTMVFDVVAFSYSATLFDDFVNNHFVENIMFEKAVFLSPVINYLQFDTFAEVQRKTGKAVLYENDMAYVLSMVYSLSAGYFDFIADYNPRPEINRDVKVNQLYFMQKEVLAGTMPIIQGIADEQANNDTFNDNSLLYKSYEHVKYFRTDHFSILNNRDALNHICDLFRDKTYSYYSKLGALRQIGENDSIMSWWQENFDHHNDIAGKSFFIDYLNRIYNILPDNAVLLSYSEDVTFGLMKLVQKNNGNTVVINPALLSVPEYKAKIETDLGIGIESSGLRNLVEELAGKDKEVHLTFDSPLGGNTDGYVIKGFVYHYQAGSKDKIDIQLCEQLIASFDFDYNLLNSPNKITGKIAHEIQNLLLIMANHYSYTDLEKSRDYFEKAKPIMLENPLMEVLETKLNGKR